MKTKLITILALLIFSVSYSQWSAEAGVGIHNVNDPSFTEENSFDFSHINLGIRYNFNKTFGLKLMYGRNISKGHSVEYGIPTDFFYKPSQYFKLTYNRLSLEATVDVLDVLDVHSDVFTLLTSGGVGVSRVATSGHTQDMGLMSATVTGVFKLSNNLGIKLDYNVASHIDQAKTLDLQYRANAEGITSNVHSGSVGLIYYFGDSDFKQPKDCCIKSDTTIINNNNIVNKTEVTKVIKPDYKPIIREYVFFDHDKHDIRKSELNAIMQIFTVLKENKKAKVHIIGWASDTKSSAKYNLALSERRCKELVKKFMDLGVPLNRIGIDPSGKDYDMSKENVHDLARRVELLILR